jgi:hypothetical protein
MAVVILQKRWIMVVRTLSDCSRCQYLAECDAHISKGTHKHREKPDPCELDFSLNTVQGKDEFPF